MTQFRLSAQLVGHEQDVKAARAASNDSIVSVSRDHSVRLWSRTAPNALGDCKVYLGHNGFVNAVAFMQPSPDYSHGLIVSGGSDKTINVYDLNLSTDPLRTLIGHTDNVCCLDLTPSEHIVSGSWDKTIKMWKNWQLSDTMSGHTAAVWAVLAIDDNTIISGSADKSIVRWNNSKPTHTYTGHTDCVRALALLPNIGFVSCGNDSTLRIWTLAGDCLQELNGHTSFVYSLAVLPSGEIVSSGEDRSVRVWKDNKCIQTISHPAVSVWCVDAIPNGDIVSGASDGVVRVFTRAPERLADEGTLKEFDEAVASQAIPSNQVGDLNKDSLPGPDALLHPGNEDGQVLMVRVDNVVEAHQWNAASRTWIKIGEVVDAVGQGRKQLYQGREYDYVFDVDIGDGVPPLKLPYNVTDNPYEVAQQFIWDNELPQSYLDQIANFIVTNTGGVALGTSSNQYADPLTGSSRYQPSSQTSRSTVQQQPPLNTPNTFASGIDPWTRPAPTTSNLIPQKTYITFRQANVAAIVRKLKQLNVEADVQTVALTTEELTTLEGLAKYLEDPLSGSNISQERHREFAIIRKMLTTWPYGKRFPALDLLRLSILYTPVPVKHSDDNGNIVKLLKHGADLASWPKEGNPSKEQDINLMLSARVLANLFSTRDGVDILKREGMMVFEQVSGTWSRITKNARAALAAVFLNFAVLFKEPQNEDDIIQLMATLVEFLESETDSEVMYNSILALGTLISKSMAAREAASAFDIKKVVQTATAKVKESKVKSVAAEINKLV